MRAVRAGEKHEDHGGHEVVLDLEHTELPTLPPHCSDGQEPSTWLEVILHEGMNRQVRRMTKHAGHYTIRLVRAGVGRLRLEDLGLRPGECRPIAASDVV